MCVGILTSTSKLNADIKENMKARAKGVIKEGDTVIDLLL
jgi:hypothetical protein